MENISQLVDDSLARHGVRASFDHFRLQWSKWFRCQSSFSVLLAPSKPGIFALAEEILPCVPEEVELRVELPAGKRMLALFHISETVDLGMSLGSLFLPRNPLRERLGSRTCFACYTILADPAERSAACEIFQRWLEQFSETASGIHRARGAGVAGVLARDIEQPEPGGADTSVREGQETTPSISLAWSLDAGIQELPKVVRASKPVASSF